jgi:phosphatidylserine/phosphatidylglycerophosphate/cardiolipin synthase-like enzyme
MFVPSPTVNSLTMACSRWLWRLFEKQVFSIKVNQHDGLMHLKQVVDDDEVNTNCSMNHTTSGNRPNDEQLDVIRDNDITVKACKKFLSMWKDERRFRLWKE